MIELKEVSFSYEGGEREAGLRDINLTILDGEVILLCGESGCGKTTLTRLLNGLIPNYYEGMLTGRVLVNGKDVSKAPLYETAGMVGSVFQNPRAQFFNVDTTSELAFGCENMGMDEAEIHRRIQQTIKDLMLEPLMDRSIFALSGGEKQKIACASICALHPEVIVLDEPSSNLDAVATAELRQLLSHWKSGGKTVVISEHRLHYLRSLADRVLYMQNGRIVQEFSAAQFVNFTVSELAALGLRPNRLESLMDSSVLFKPRTEMSNISFSNFHFTYQNYDEALKIDHLSLPQGSIIAVIGHNGAGKSTFARCLCGLEKKCKGVMEYRTGKFKTKERLKHCYMVMQDVNHQLFTESVLDEVLLSMEHEDEAKAEEILKSLNLLDMKELHPMSLSGGQKQRVAIASAVASGRKTILFDEPTSGLDLRHMREVADNIIKLSEQGKTVFVITHDPELVLCCCTHVMQMSGGAAVADYTLDNGGIPRMLSFFLEQGLDSAERTAM